MSDSEVSMKIDVDFSHQSSPSLNQFFSLAYAHGLPASDTSTHKRSCTIEYRNDEFLNLIASHHPNFTYSDVLNICISASIELYRYCFELRDSFPQSSDSNCVSEHDEHWNITSLVPIDGKQFFLDLAKKHYERVLTQNPHLAQSIKQIGGIEND